MEDDELVNMYRAESEKSIKDESEQRINSGISMKERIRLRSNSLKELILEDQNHNDLIPSLLERLGPVRSALDGHGGGIVIKKISFESNDLINFILTLNGSCIACGAAPSTLVGIRYDLENDTEINAIHFEKELLDTFDELSREFLISQTDLSFKST